MNSNYITPRSALSTWKSLCTILPLKIKLHTPITIENIVYLNLRTPFCKASNRLPMIASKFFLLWNFVICQVYLCIINANKKSEVTCYMHAIITFPSYCHILEIVKKTKHVVKIKWAIASMHFNKTWYCTQKVLP